MLIVKLNERYLKIENETIEISKDLANWIALNTKTLIRFDFSNVKEA